MACSDIRIIAEALDRYAAAMNFYPVTTPRPVEVAEIQSDLTPRFAARLPILDPWGHPYRYWSEGGSYFIGSSGSDGRPDGWEERLFQDRRGMRAAIQDVCNLTGAMKPGGDIVFIEGRFCGLPREITLGAPGRDLTDEDRQLATAREIRIIATALMAYALDNNIHPVVMAGLGGVAALRPLLEPIYVRALPMSDAWGHPYLYWSNGTDWLVLSSGKDGEDRAYGGILADTRDSKQALAAICTEPIEGPGDDIVFANDQPCRWPRGAGEDR